MSNRPKGMQEFAGTIGEQQRSSSGDDIYALARAPGAPVTRAPQGSQAAAQARALAAPPQVLSTFDARPVGAYDFVTLVQTTNQLEPLVPTAQSLQVPEGFTMVVRRVEFEPVPAFDGGGTGSLRLWLIKDNTPIQLNNFQLFGLYDQYGWDTYQVVGQGHLFGFDWDLVGAPSSGVLYEINFRVFGTLIRTMGRPPEADIGSGPLNVKGA